MQNKFQKTQSLFSKFCYNFFIQTKQTPNPDFLKFIPSGKTVMENGTHDFANIRYTHNSVLARKLFLIDGVTRVFYGNNFISISKHEDHEWGNIKPQIFSEIMEQFTGEEPLFTDEPEPEDTKINDNDSEIVATIKEILNTRIRPIVQEDGGDIEYKGFFEDTGLVNVVMKGACTGCPSSQVTLKNGIEKMLMHYVPEVKSVEAMDYNGESNDKEFNEN